MNQKPPINYFVKPGRTEGCLSQFVSDRICGLNNTGSMEIGIPLESSGDQPELQENEECTLNQSSIHLHFNDIDLGNGRLVLGTKRAYWISTSNPVHLNLAMEYHSIGLHAICQDVASWPVPCLYCQLDMDSNVETLISNKLSQLLDKPIMISSPSSTSDSNTEVEEDEPALTELRFAPSDASSLPTIFTKFTEMSTLNPDPNTTMQSENELLRHSNWCTADNSGEWNPDFEDANNDDEDELMQH